MILRQCWVRGNGGFDDFSGKSEASGGKARMATGSTEAEEIE
jgi:hypothetical protein